MEQITTGCNRLSFSNCTFDFFINAKDLVQPYLLKENYATMIPDQHPIIKTHLASMYEAHRDSYDTPGSAEIKAFARPRSGHIRAWRGSPNSYRDILGVYELIFSNPTTLLEEAWSNSKKLYNKNFKVEVHNFQFRR